jgi:hypothetical protein
MTEFPPINGIDSGSAGVGLLLHRISGNTVLSPRLLHGRR